MRNIFIVLLLFIVSDSVLADTKTAIYNELSQSVVMLCKDASCSSGGTGFIVDGGKGAYTITNWHVCAIAKDKYLYANRAGEFSEVKLEIIASDPTHDLCILKKAPGKAVPFGRKPIRYKALYVLGHPNLKPLTPAEGRYIAEVEVELIAEAPANTGKCPKGSKSVFNPFKGQGCKLELSLQDTTIPIFPGNSGSPAVDDDGLLVGVINSSETSTFQGAMIGIDYVREFLKGY